jgi:hypothetical protein
MNALTTREDFMKFYRDDEKLNLLTVDDRIEIFSQILLGQSDFTLELFEDLFSNYDIAHMKIIEVKNGTISLD